MVAVVKFAFPPLLPVPAELLGRFLPGLERPERLRNRRHSPGTRASESGGTGPGRRSSTARNLHPLSLPHLDWRRG